METFEEVPPEALLSSPTISSTTTTESAKPNESSYDPDILNGISEENGNLSKIELMELRQKEVEEGNKRKRLLLLQEIADRWIYLYTIYYTLLEANHSNKSIVQLLSPFDSHHPC